MPLPKKLNKYSSFEEKANYVLLTYLHPKDIKFANKGLQVLHDMKHAGEVAIYVDIITELWQEFKRDFLAPLQHDPELIEILKIAALFHDAGRISDFGDDHGQ